ncbi:MAG: hypothetical protein H6551_07445 [Chitinophagales bacterium]|nr:hypothetical protein [Chitinophagales bacterium]
MGTNISLNNKEALKTNAAIFFALLMLAGFLFSRAMLSTGIIAFGVIGVFGVHPRQWFKSKWWLWGLLWVGVYFLSGLWSDYMSGWGGRVGVKLPILLLPLAFSLMPGFSNKQKTVFTIGAAVLFLSGVFYSISFLIADPAYYIEGYRLSKVLPTLAQHDYIRYSLSISLFVIWCLAVWPKLVIRVAKWFIAATIVLLVFYIHIIAVKTGVLALYTFVICWGFYTILQKRVIVGIGLILFLILAAVGAYKYIPTFENKVDYFRYSWEVLEQGHYDSNYSDIGRLVSYDVTRRILPEHLLYGTGVGDLYDEMCKGYDEYYPKVPDSQKLVPHNQFMVVALGCGIPTLVLFVIWVFFPLTWVKKSRDGFFLFAVWVIMFIPLMVEPFLELQFGVYVYLFYILWFAHNLKPQKTVEQ